MSKRKKSFTGPSGFYWSLQYIQKGNALSRSGYMSVSTIKLLYEYRMYSSSGRHTQRNSLSYVKLLSKGNQHSASNSGKRT